MIQLALLRHGHTAWNRAGRIQGRSDIPLDEQARLDLSALQLPARWRDAHVVSSPLQRAVETAQLVSDRTPKTHDALIEMDWGNWEGQRGEDLNADANSGFRHIEAWGWHYAPPQGETPDQVRARLLDWLGTLEQDTVAVCHIGIMRVLMAMATGWNFDGPAPFRVKRNRLFVLSLEGTALELDPSPVRLEPR
ncbi:MAG: histidine phosphatase family protein [Tateyamaria sp.]